MIYNNFALAWQQIFHLSPYGLPSKLLSNWVLEWLYPVPRSGPQNLNGGITVRFCPEPSP
jgi:hypothetical protein